MKKGIFSALNFILPWMNLMHCSANVGDKDDTPFSLVCLEPGKQLYQQIQKKINWWWWTWMD
jgi:hypothetical protein